MTDRTPRAQALAEHVISLPELLANILEQLDQRTLLCSAQRVCRDWRDLVTSSLPIQRRLFFKPTPARHDDRSRRAGDAGEDARLNPLLAEKFRPLFQQRNAAARRAFEEIFFGPGIVKARPPTTRKHELLLREDASWRAMLTQQPPAYRVFLWSERQNGQGARPAAALAILSPLQPYRIVEFPAGLRMGELYDMCLGTAEEPLLSFRPFWFRRRTQLVPDPDEMAFGGSSSAGAGAGAGGRDDWSVATRKILLDELSADAAALALLAPVTAASTESREEDGDGRGDDGARPSQVDAVVRLYKMGMVPPSTRKSHIKHMSQFIVPKMA